MFSDGVLSNVVSGDELHQDDIQYLLSCYEEGEKRYETYREERLVTNKVKLFDAIKKPPKRKRNKDKENIDLAAEKANLARTVDIARVQGYDIKELLSYEITSTSFYLTKDGFLKKPDKSELVRLLKVNEVPELELKKDINICEKALL